MPQTILLYALALVGAVWLASRLWKLAVKLSTPEPLAKGEFIDGAGRRRSPFSG